MSAAMRAVMRAAAVLLVAGAPGCAALKPPPASREQLLAQSLRPTRSALSSDGATALLAAPAPGRCFRAELVRLGAPEPRSLSAVEPASGTEACALWTAVAGGNTLAVYAYNEGVVRLVERDGGDRLRLGETLRLPGVAGFPNPPPGRNLSLTPDGATLLVGAAERGCDPAMDGPTRCGAAYLYRRAADGAWRLAAEIPRPRDGGGPEANFGPNVLALGDGTVLVGGTGLPGGPGLLHRFRVAADGTAARLQTLAPADPKDWFFTTDLAASADGERLAVGGSQHVALYRRGADGLYALAGRLDAPDDNAGHFGAALAMNAGGTALLVGAPRAPCRAGLRCGIVFRYTRDGERWRPAGVIRPAEARREADFGYVVSTDAGGGTSLIGADVLHAFTPP